MFRRVSDLIRHIRTIHINRDAYRCAIDGCGRTFGRSDHLRVHQMVHQRQDQIVNFE
ncbi:hypothetical protein BJX63DRAFT_407974 [Aspergillus granulosus]|uniref:C2H2-type domain-containing protein n=1 Tax=Aspergillus granulosus TaxID=176169 RepID=A0ABR4GZX0_9EURO